jgi:sulfur carrier protein ThiS
MKIRVKLFGNLRKRFPDYYRQQGMEVEIPDGTMAKDLLSLLRISESNGAVAPTESRILKGDDRIQGGAHVDVLQAMRVG